MSDLISRSELYNLPIYKFGVSMLSAEEYIKVSDIEKMPTAYDIDNVISKIRRASGNGYRDIDCDYVPPMIETKEAIEIVKQEAEQYNNAIIDGKYCFQSCACTEKCDKCSRLCNGYIDWYENIDNWTEEYNNGWIQFSEHQPDYGESVLVSFNQARQPLIATFYENDTWKMLQGVNGLIDITNEVIAWQPLPKPFQKGE